ncbi:aldo/keto reductase [Allokutzneria albata]|uniref:D-threo-aldose 1-dehydrogenase n=1 Tax=Allokutzneria albata TaxID=211114 RepID=A0A1H0AT49_ALLAB|nr:aldo/keto reductase [Allokutzneria albata]SDN36495.1 D-threo-aldose 1-dehydrogenase [Allokutzneria albata]
MREVQLGRTDVRVSALGFGAAPMAGLYREVSEEIAAGSVAAALDAGVSYFDTAPHYGLGLSERRLGKALASASDFVISTKVGRRLEPVPVVGDDMANGFAVPATHRRVWDFSADGVLASVESSLDRLGLSRVDILLLHDPDDHWDQAVGEALPALAELREKGAVGAIGAGMNQWQMLARFVAETSVDVVMLAGRYTLLEQSALDELLPLCSERQVSVIAAAVFNSGILSRPVVAPDATYNYEPAPPALIDRARRMAEVCGRFGVTLPQAALQFPLGHPAVASVVIGARTGPQMAENARMFGDPVPAECWAALKSEGLLRPDAPVPT